MRNLFAAIYFLLALFGCESGGTTLVTRSVIDGIDVIHARTHVKAGVARFECLASASGQCHYILILRECKIELRRPTDGSPHDPCRRKTGNGRLA